MATTKCFWKTFHKKHCVNENKIKSEMKKGKYLLRLNSTNNKDTFHVCQYLKGLQEEINKRKGNKRNIK